MASLEERKAQLKAMREAREARQQQLAAAAASIADTPAVAAAPQTAPAAAPVTVTAAANAPRHANIVSASKVLSIDVLPSSKAPARAGNNNSPPPRAATTSTIKSYEVSTQTEGAAAAPKSKGIELSDSDKDAADQADPAPTGAAAGSAALEATSTERQGSILTFTARQPQFRSLLDRAIDLETGASSSSPQRERLGLLQNQQQQHLSAFADDDTMSNSSFSSSAGLSSAGGFPAAGESLLDKIGTQNHAHLRVVDFWSLSSSSSSTVSSAVTQVCFAPQAIGPLLAAVGTSNGEVFVVHPSGFVASNAGAGNSAAPTGTSGAAAAATSSGVSVVAKLHCGQPSQRGQTVTSLLFLSAHPDLLAAGTAGGRLLLFDLRERRGAPVCTSLPSIDGHSGEAVLAIIEPPLAGSETTGIVSGGAAGAALRYGAGASYVMGSGAGGNSALARLVTVGSATVCTWGIGDVVARVSDSSPLLAMGNAAGTPALLVAGGHSVIAPSSSVAMVAAEHEKPLHVACCSAGPSRLCIGARDGCVYSKPLGYFLELRGRTAPMERARLTNSISEWNAAGNNAAAAASGDAAGDGADRQNKQLLAAQQGQQQQAQDATELPRFLMPVCAVARRAGSGVVAATVDGTLLYSAGDSAAAVRSFEDALQAPAVGVRFCANGSSGDSSVSSFVVADSAGTVSLWQMDTAASQHLEAGLTLRHSLALKGAASSPVTATCIDVDAQQMRLAAVGTREGGVHFVAIPAQQQQQQQK